MRTSTARGTTRLQIVRDQAGLAPLRGPWTELLTASADRSPFISWEWTDAWLRGFPSRDRPHVLVVRRGATPVAIAPLLRCGGVGRIPPVFIGLGQEAADYGGFLLGPDGPETGDLIAHHLAGLVRHGAVVLLTRLSPEGDSLPLLQERFGPNAGGPVRLTRMFAEEYPYLDLASIPHLEQHVTRALRDNDVRRQFRRLCERWPAEFVYHRSPRTHPGALDEFLGMHDARWAAKDEAGTGRATGLFASESGHRFLRLVSERFEETGWLRLSFLDVDGKPAAAHFGMEFDGCYYGMKPTFDPQFSAFGPGHLIVGMLLQEAATSGLRRIDYMRGGGGHKKKWAGGTREVGYYALHRTGQLGRAELRWAWNVLRWRNHRRYLTTSQNRGVATKA